MGSNEKNAEPAKPTEKLEDVKTSVTTQSHTETSNDPEPTRHDNDDYDDPDTDESKADFDAEETNPKESTE